MGWFEFLENIEFPQVPFFKKKKNANTNVVINLRSGIPAPFKGGP